jgi:thiol-disulfide isomerase/thioredoxin
VSALRLAALAAVIVLGGCAGDPEAPGPLPGPVPAGVTFHEPPASAPTAPVFTLELLDGGSLELAEQWRQRPVVLVFFESWCTRCRDQQPGINEVAEQYRDVVLFVGVASQSEPADVERYTSDAGIAYPVGIDPSGRAALRYAVAEPPLVALVSKGGRLLRGWPEGVSGTELRDHIDREAVASR